MKLQLIALLCSALALAEAQNYPQRLNIAGAVPSPGQQPHRQPVLRVRRPGPSLRQQNAILPAVTQRIAIEERPVTEAAEDEQPEPYLPNLLREQQLAQAQQSQFQQAAAAFLAGQQPIEQPSPVQQFLQNEDSQPAAILPPPARFAAERPSIPTPQNRPAAFNDFGIGRFENSQRFGLERPTPTAAAPPPPPPPPQPQRVAVIRTRPAAPAAFRPEPPAPQQVARPRPKPVQPRPLIDQNQLQDERAEHQQQQQQRRQRPVAQTIRKWREENEDGSITWGYENDDGSFKEELIGTDCITKGTYGYIDPDGNKREYHYETGIKCDPNARENEEELQENGFINYEENRAVLPNGLEIDMAQLGKKKSKRPNSIYRN